MSAKVTVTGIRGGKYSLGDEPETGYLRVRKKTSKPTNCIACNDRIDPGEQYISLGNDRFFKLCLGCAEYE